MRARERLVFGLRQMEGVHAEDFARATHFTLEALVGPAIANLIQLGLLERTRTHIKLTREGLMLSDAVMGQLLRDNRGALSK
jgi:oxygen-independent coproporphyrinogen-3 oxidase